MGGEVGELLGEGLAGMAAVEAGEVAGRVRRRMEIMEDVQVVVATKAPAKVIAAIHADGIVADAETLEGRIIRGRVRNEIDVVIHIADSNDFGATLLVATGSAEFLEASSARASKNGCELRQCSPLKRS